MAKAKKKAASSLHRSRKTGTKASRMRLVPVKCDANGCRLSASFYYNVLCDGHIKRCKPQLVKGVLKCIRIVRGANGKEPRWVRA